MGTTKNTKNGPVICGNIDIIKILLKSIILFLRYFLSINAGVTVTSNIFDTDFNYNKIQFKAGVKKWVLQKHTKMDQSLSAI